MKVTKFVTDIIAQLSGAEPTVKETVDEDGLVIDITVNGRISNVIGKQGRNIEAIRTLAKAIGHEDNHRIKVKVNESTNQATD